MGVTVAVGSTVASWRVTGAGLGIDCDVGASEDGVLDAVSEKSEGSNVGSGNRPDRESGSILKTWILSSANGHTLLKKAPMSAPITVIARNPKNCLRPIGYYTTLGPFQDGLRSISQSVKRASSRHLLLAAFTSGIRVSDYR